MKYQFTTEGSKPQTKYHHLVISDYDPEGQNVFYQTIVSTPLPAYMLEEYLRDLINPLWKDLCITVRESYGSMPSYKEVGSMCIKPVGLDTIARIVSNIKPLKVKMHIVVNGEEKTYSIDPDKVDVLLKSLE